MKSEPSITRALFAYSRTALFILTVLLFVSASFTSYASESRISDSLRQALSEKRHLTLDHVRIETSTLKAFYSARDYAPVWVDSDGLSARAMDALQIISRANEHGLDASEYGIKTLHTLTRTNHLRNQKDTRIQAMLEILTSHIMVSYLEDMHYGYTSPNRKLRGDIVDTRMRPLTLLEHAARTHSLVPWLESQTPARPEYTELKHALITYQAMAEQGGWPAFLKGKTLKPGDTNPRIATLRRILEITGDLEAAKGLPWRNQKHVTSAPATSPDHYDDLLKQAVMRFQARHGLNGDGAIGGKTQEALAVPIEKRIDQIKANMERLRWMPRLDQDRYIVVNIPGFYLKAYDKGREALNMRVVVGMKSRKTPEFDNAINAIVFNPTWTPTTKIINKDVIPKAKKNPNYLVNGGFTVTDRRTGARVDPSQVDWSGASARDYSFRQRGGGRSALGKVKFSLPNSNAIYLHDTSHPELFVKDYRALSSGCIRVEDPNALTHYVMHNQPGWDADTVESKYQSRATKHVSVSAVPVHAVYWTAWAEPNGTVHFHEDVYKKDTQLIAKLPDAQDSTPIQLAKR